MTTSASPSQLAPERPRDAERSRLRATRGQRESGTGPQGVSSSPPESLGEDAARRRQRIIGA